MTQEIEPGDLIRNSRGEVEVFGNFLQSGLPCNIILIAKGPPDAPWTRHDGSATNPVPGAEVEGYTSGGLWSPRENPTTGWRAVQFYRVTRAVIPSQEELAAGRVVERFDPAPSQPSAPQPGWVATVTLEWVGTQGSYYTRIRWPNGAVEPFETANVDPLDWQPPPPPPWEPVVGEDADWKGDLVIVRALFEGRAWVEDFEGDLVTADLSDLSPPEGGEA